MPKISGLTGIDLVKARKAPERDNGKYFLWPPKNNDYGAKIFAEKALESLPENSILLADYTLWRPLYYVQEINKFREDVQIIWVEKILDDGVAKYIDHQECNKKIFFATDTPKNYYDLDKAMMKYEVFPYKSVFAVKRPCN